MPAAASGTQTATIGTEHTLATLTTDSVFVLAVRLANMVDGDLLELRVKTKLTSGDTSETAFYLAAGNAPGEEKKAYSPPIVSPFEAVFTLKQTAGTGRSFVWAVYTV